MKPRIIFMMLLLSGALSSCGKYIIDYNTKVEKIYTNETAYSVELVGYLSDTDGAHTYNWGIASNSSISFNYVLPNSFVMNPKFCDSLRVIFNDGKQILYKNGEGLFIPEKTEEFSKHGVRYYYTITKTMYDAAEYGSK